MDGLRSIYAAQTVFLQSAGMPEAKRETNVRSVVRHDHWQEVRFQHPKVSHPLTGTPGAEVTGNPNNAQPQQTYAYLHSGDTTPS